MEPVKLLRTTADEGLSTKSNTKTAPIKTTKTNPLINKTNPNVDMHTASTPSIFL
jgi:hypothetical protein